MIKLNDWKMKDEVKHIYFLGIGGIGMSALARHLHHQGIKISGYDRDRTELTKKLEQLGMQIVYDFEESKVPASIDVVIYTPAIKEDQQEYIYFNNTGVEMLKRSEALKSILDAKRVIAVAGTHGKTTTCALLSHLMYDCKAEVTAIIGGIMSNYSSNYLYGSSDWIIVEADEYDRSFLRLHPEVLVIQAMDADHLDIYEDEADMIDAYKQLTLQMKKGGVLWVEANLAAEQVDDDWKRSLSQMNISLKTFGVVKGDVHGANIKANDGTTCFELNSDLKTTFELQLPGLHNLQNAMAALAVCKDHNLGAAELSKAMSSFKGVSRRFEYVHRSDELIIINDYAHHPVEIKAAIATAREHHGQRRLTVVFQPHLYTRTRDFLNDFARELSKADETILVELYPAREHPIEGIDSKRVLSLLTNEENAFVKMKELAAYLKIEQRELILLLGAGDLYKYQDSLI